MKILVIGSGGREHALCWKISKSPLVNELYCAPANAGIGNVATVIDISSSDFEAIGKFCQDKAIDMVVIGPEDPLVNGLTDFLEQKGFLVFGPSKQAAMLEGSKAFTKHICDKYNIPTASYAEFEELEPAKDYVRKVGAPIVVKADGLAAGKGVVVAMTENEALAAIDDIMGGKFGSAGNKVVIEEFLQGTEVSFFAICDGEKAVEFASAQDHKRAFDGDKGPNTGGMGTFSPSPLMTENERKKVMESIIIPTVEGMKAEGKPFKGVLFAGLMMTKDGAKLLEYNTRFGDPETQSMLSRMKDDIVPLLLSAAKGELDSSYLPDMAGAAACVVMAARGYPEAYQKGSVISGLDGASEIANVFHAGTALKDGKIVANGGRVLGVTATGDSISEARDKAYAAVKKINWDDGFYRSDIAA